MKKPRCAGPFDLCVEPADGALAQAQEAVRALLADPTRTGDVRVRVKAGEYRTSGLTFTEADGGKNNRRVSWVADDGAVINGGLALRAWDFAPAAALAESNATAARLPEGGKNVLVCDLKRYGLARDDWGPVYALGGTGARYDGYVAGSNCSLYVDGERMTLARYPNRDEFLRLAAVADIGEVAEYPEQNYFANYDRIRNPRQGTFVTDKATCDRMKRWATTEGAWLFGYFYHDWADMSTPIKAVNLDNRLVTPLYNSYYGYRAGGRFYFFNVPEELDAPGEWYLDREEGLLYLYPPKPLINADIRLEGTGNTLLDIRADNLTFDGFTFTGTRGDAVRVAGSGNVISNCTITAVSGLGAALSGSGNVIRDCEISHVGKGGISLSGGDRATLSQGNNRAENNLIHDFAEIYLTYHPGVSLNGVGNAVAHNEIYHAPHAAILYGGNDHLIEYNLIHHVVRWSSDAGAIYTGRDWTGQGTVIRYNCLYDIGDAPNSPDGIYFDDAHSGQTAYGNLLVNVRKFAFLIGGGRDNVVRDNIIVDAGKMAVHFDARARDGFVSDGWYRSIRDRRNSQWQALDAMPIRKGIWAERYPSLARISDDFERPDDPEFACNPSHNVVSGNIVLDDEAELGWLADAVYRYSEVGSNPVYPLDGDAGFVDATNGDYTLRPDSPVYRLVPGFLRDTGGNIPYAEIGRV
ncbi:MAG: right-handed parallel beta-helix repeat-containing protein [Candidatus Latescibacterota bacterium]